MTAPVALYLDQSPFRTTAVHARAAEAKALSEQALAVARQLGAERELGRALTALGLAEATLGNSDAAIASLRQACQLVGRHADAMSIAEAHGLLADALIRAGRLEEAAQAALAGRRQVRDLGLDGHWADNFLLLNAADALFKLGRWDEAEQLARLVLAHTEEWYTSARLAAAALEVGQGDFQTATTHLDTVKAHWGRNPLPDARSYFELVAELSVWQASLDEARAAVGDGLAMLKGTDEQPWLGELLWLGLRTEADRAERGRARRDLDDVADAIHHARALQAQVQSMPPTPLAPDATPIVTTTATAALWNAEHTRLHGRSDPTRWQAAADAWLALRQPYPAAYAHWRQAEALLGRTTQASQAAVPLRHAHTAAQRLGARPLLGEITALARRARIILDDPGKPGKPVAVSPLARLGLTERELEVLKYVAAGRSNREIGQALFISAKTASVHVSNILRKLQVTSRVQAATAAHRLGLIDEDPQSTEPPVPD